MGDDAMAVNIVIPKFGSFSQAMQNWTERELRSGSRMFRYVEREKANYRARQAKVAARHRDYQRRRGSDFELVSVLDARTWFRMFQESGGAIFEDAGELKKFIRDNPEVEPWRH